MILGLFSRRIEFMVGFFSPTGACKLSNHGFLNRFYSTRHVSSCEIGLKSNQKAQKAVCYPHIIHATIVAMALS